MFAKKWMRAFEFIVFKRFVSDEIFIFARNFIMAENFMFWARKFIFLKNFTNSKISFL